MGCYLAGPPTLGTTFCILSLLSFLVTAMACTTAHATSITALAIACIIVSCSVVIFDFFYICLEVPFVRLLFESAYF